LSEVLQNVQSVAVGVAVGNAIGVGVADSVAFGDILVLKKDCPNFGRSDGRK
jgi:uncharacterized protein YebE (UPF0316 family)